MLSRSVTAFFVLRSGPIPFLIRPFQAGPISVLFQSLSYFHFSCSFSISVFIASVYIHSILITSFSNLLPFCYHVSSILTLPVSLFHTNLILSPIHTTSGSRLAVCVPVHHSSHSTLPTLPTRGRVCNLCGTVGPGDPPNH